MILPTKNIKLEDSIIYLSGLLLNQIHETDTVSSLWERFKSSNSISSFGRYTLLLSFLYTIEAITIEDGILRKIKKC
ncbi:hypothetical protein QEJ31_14590 [Pigmentibacter sp. JX0631]|uniref:ABC-three component system middle component 6 n=1 Tax=Pigmentibacter sp. JX0631 TaxID=2976982 RepID=UPI00246885EB|nr:ABC-three component system middle component 6 [Pigmentibacter sp. JX0631]WGL59757.1 hypothetical protein QEJ31_14590 [Pigmentibacter sp. JX0631]